MMYSNRAGIILLSASIILGSACKHEPEFQVCEPKAITLATFSNDPRIVSDDVWLELLISGYRRSAQRLPDDPRHCGKRRISNAEAGFASADPGQPTPLGADPLSYGFTSDGRLLVWAKVESMADGDALGPVALAQWNEPNLEVRGIGTLRAPAKRTKLYLVPQSQTTSILFAEGDSCPEGTKLLASCERAVQIAVLRGQRFESYQIQEGDDTPVPPRIALSARFDSQIDGDMIQRTTLQRKVKVTSGQLIVHEVIKVERCDRGGERCQVEATHDEPRVITLSEKLKLLRTDHGTTFALNGAPLSQRPETSP